MVDVLVWLVAVEAFGLAAFPLCYYLFPRLRDRGYSVSKPAGLLIFGYLSWVLSVLHILPSSRLTLAGLLIVIAGASWWYLWTRHGAGFRSFLVQERRTIILVEAVFLAVFLGWVLYRAYDPAIDHTEQPMDFAFLNASVRSYVGQPEDPWLRGETVSYYYFGYWMMASLTKLTGMLPSVAYNLSLALVAAMAASGMFGLVYGLVRADTKRLRYAVTAGLAAAVLLVFTANLEGVLEFMRANGMGASQFWDSVRIDGLDAPASALSDSWRPQENWWWWRATRVISSYEGGQLVDYTIHEFPFFSFMLGDLHPHAMSLPFVILFLALCWNLLTSPDPVRRELVPGGYITALVLGLIGLALVGLLVALVAPTVLLSLSWRVVFASVFGALVLVGAAITWRAHDTRGKVSVLSAGLALGGLAFTNMWDLPVFSAVLLGVVGLRALSRARADGRSLAGAVAVAVSFAAVAVAVALILFLPYFLSFTSQVSGISPAATNISRPLHLLIVWGIFLVAVTPFIMGTFWRTTVREDWRSLTVASLVVAFLPYVVWAFLYLEEGGIASEAIRRLFHILPFALLIGVAVYTALWLTTEDRPSLGKVFALGLATLGLMLIMGPELLYVDDGFGGAHERMNTVFKLYYQGWVVLAAASGFALYYWSSLRDEATGGRRLLANVWAAVFVALLVGAGYYPLAAAATKGDLFRGDATLDGLSFVGSGEYGAIQYIRERAGRDSAVLEAVGDDYSAFGRISASTGVPTVLGWLGHELQWRGSAEPSQGREEDVSAIYQTLDVEEAKTLLAKYDVDYVYVGRRETSKYGADGLEKFSSFMDTVFSEDGIVVYRMKP